MFANSLYFLLWLFADFAQYQGGSKNVAAISLVSVFKPKLKRTVLVMASNDGKSKKKKKSGQPQLPSANPSTTNVNSEPSSPSSRVTNQINIPIRQQIAWAKAYKRLMTQSSSSSTGQAKKFRRKGGTKVVEEEYVEINYVETKPPAVFVDGYNIIGYMKQTENNYANVPLDDARESLISDLSVLRGATGWWIEVIFDAYLNQTPEKQEFVDNILVTYTGKDETADNHIERRFVKLRNDGFTNMVVATDDNALRLAAGTSGNGFLSAAMLLEELRIAYKGWEYAAEDLERESQRQKPTIADGLSDDIRRAIEMMKQKR